MAVNTDSVSAHGHPISPSALNVFHWYILPISLWVGMVGSGYWRVLASRVSARGWEAAMCVQASGLTLGSLPNARAPWVSAPCFLGPPYWADFSLAVGPVFLWGTHGTLPYH